MAAYLLAIAPPGAGKTTLRPRLAELGRFAAVCRDDIRELLWGDPADMGDEGKVSALANGLGRTYVRNGVSVYVDATNLRARFRKQEVDNAHKVGAEAWAFLRKYLPYDEIRRRNSERDRIVPDNVLDRMLDDWSQISPESLAAEGFDRVYAWDDESWERFV